MSVAEELIVQVRTEGIDIAQDGLRNLSDAVEDFVAEVKEGSAQLTDFIGGFRGALQAIVAGVVVVAGALASQIPIIGELLAGLGAVGSAVGLKLDDILRPTLSNIVEDLYELATAIMEADDFGDVMDAIRENTVAALVAIGSFISAVGIAAKVLGVSGALTGLFIAALKGLVGIAVAVVGAIAGFLGIPVILAAVLVALVAFATAWALDLGSTREVTKKIVEAIKAAWDDFVKYIGGLWDRAKEGFDDFYNKVDQWASDLADDAVQWGKDLINGMIDGIREAIPGLDYVLHRVGFNNNDLPPPAPAPSSTSLSQDYGMSMPVMLDGRNVSDRTARYRVDAARRRGL